MLFFRCHEVMVSYDIFIWLPPKKRAQTDKRKNKHLYQQQAPFSFYLYCG